MIQKFPLSRGDEVKLLATGEVVEVEHAGAAGFTVKGWAATRYWNDRGLTWSSDKLDRQDEARERFARAAGKAGTT